MARAVPLDATPDLESTGPRAKLALVEGLLAEQDARSCAVLALRWLSRHAGVRRGFCAVVDSDGSRLSGLAGHGVPLAEVDAWSVDLGERSHPLALALVGAEPVACHGSGPRSGLAGMAGLAGIAGAGLETPLGTESFQA